MDARDLPAQRRDSLAVLASLFVPFAIALALVPFRGSFANTDAALVLVIVVVAVAANGYRLAGFLAAASAAVWFDFFLTFPYQRFAITDRTDVETTVLLLIVGAAVTELAVWGRRQSGVASRQAGYLAGIYDAAGSVDDDAPPAVVVDQVRDQLILLLSLSDCRFDYGTGRLGGEHPRLRQDGQVEVHGAICDVESFGLPIDHDIELHLSGDGGFRGRFLLRAAPDSRPSLAQRLVAVGLADRAAAALARQRLRPGA